MTDSGLQGWSPDPFQVHEQRYFSGGRPTKLVRDGDRESYDEPPSDSYQPAAVVLATVPMNDISDRDLNQLRGVLPGLTLTIWIVPPPVGDIASVKSFL